jgi:very-short-patch-repair endonuclease
VVALYRDGLSAETIASELGCATGTIKNRLHRAAVPMRSGMARVERAHAASRGSKRTVEQLARRAKATQDRLGNQSATERALLAWLRARRLEVVPQLAVGVYNVDLAAHPIAVEVLGGNWHFARDHRKRLRYLADYGWCPLLLWVDKRQSPLDIGAADQIVALTQIARRNPPAHGQYWVVRGSGEIAATGSVYADDFALVRQR